MQDEQKTRSTISREILSVLAQEWVDKQTGSLLEDGRMIEGGWPGTVSEAKRRVLQYASSINKSLGRDENAQLAQALYHEAKVCWHSRSRSA